jgi:hypothetical protein
LTLTAINEYVKSRAAPLPLFTGLPLTFVLGKWASGIGDSRKLNIFYHSCLKALHIGSLTSRVSGLRRTRNLIVTVLQYVDATISLLPLLGPESPLLQSPVLFLLPDARGYCLTKMQRNRVLGNSATQEEPGLLDPGSWATSSDLCQDRINRSYFRLSKISSS